MDYIKHITDSLNEEDGESNGSQLNSEVALDIVKIIKDELNQLGCRLTDYYIKFNTKGFDITDIDIEVNDPARIIDSLKEAEPSVRHEFSETPIKYAFMAANVSISERVHNELGLDYEGFGYEDGDGVSVSVGEPKEEKPLPAAEFGPADMADSMGEFDFTGGPDAGEPGQEDVDAVMGGGGGGGMGGLGGLGGGMDLGAPPAGGMDLPPGEEGAEGGGEAGADAGAGLGEEPGPVGPEGEGAEFPELPEFEAGAEGVEGGEEGGAEALEAGAEGAPELPPVPGAPPKKKKRPGQEY